MGPRFARDALTLGCTKKSRILSVGARNSFETALALRRCGNTAADELQRCEGESCGVEQALARPVFRREGRTGMVHDLGESVQRAGVRLRGIRDFRGWPAICLASEIAG